MSASDLARQLRVTPTAVWNWEKNGVHPRPDMLDRIARVLGVKANFLTAGDRDETTPERRPSQSVADVIEQAQRDIADITGLPFDRIRLKVEFGSD
jgi:transcriptional regulator with XRE-family HTH domain